MADLSAGLGALLQSPEGKEALARLSAGLQNQSATPAQPAQAGGMDLSALIQAVQNAMAQGGGSPALPAGQSAPAPQPSSGGGGTDLSGLVQMVQSAMAQNNASSEGAPSSGGGGMDLSGLVQMVQSAMAQNNASSEGAPSSGGGGMDLSGLVQMVQGAMGSGGDGGGSLPAFDPAMLLLAQRAWSAFTARDKNTDLLLALKPHFSAERQQKVDDAIKILGLLRLLPLLKESGLLSKLGDLLGGEG